MKFTCLLCKKELELLNRQNTTYIVKCKGCGFTNQNLKKETKEKKTPEVMFIKRGPSQ